MKKIASIFFPLSLFCLFVLFACKKNDQALPSTGKLMGSIQTWDDKTTAIADKSGITVSTDYPTVNTTTTNASGKTCRKRRSGGNIMGFACSNRR